jgi:hypothetical protein
MPEGSLFSDAETPENFAEQVVGADFAGDPSECALGEAEFLGEKLKVAALRRRRGEVDGGFA